MKRIMLLIWLSITLAEGAEWQVIGWNDLGMHCMDGTDFSVFSILPPYNTIHAQVIHNGELVTSAAGLSVTFEAVADPDGSINTTAADKCNFWEHVADMFGVQPSNDVGLAEVAMPGVANTPQHMEFESGHTWFTGEGIPITPFDDAGRVNYYPMMKVVVRDDVGTELASTKIVLPVSDEMTCSACHQSGSDIAAQPALGWRWHPDRDKDIKLNILRLHDEKQLGNPDFFKALQAQGYNTNGLYQTVVADNIAILCARCHGSNALPGLGEPGVPPLTQVMHGHHGEVIDPATGMTLNDSANRSSCYRCHPGSDTLCLRGAMGTAVDGAGNTSMQCQSCHGNMSSVGSTNRIGWLEQPNCQACHTGTATENNGQIRYLDAYDGENLRTAVNQTFATSPDTPAAGFSLYRFSEGHGDLQCSACHGSPHAIYPSFHQNDNIQNQDLQGQAGTLGECSVCHDPAMFSSASGFLSGPHGMHQTGSDWIKQGDHNHKKAVEMLGSGSCASCHGTDFRGSVLSAALTDQTLSWSDDGQSHNQFFWQGAIISCYSCHLGPGDSDDNPRSAPIVFNISAIVSANTDAVMPVSVNNSSGLPLFTRIITPPRYGMAAISNGTHAVYRPFYNFTGTDSFTYAAYNTEKDSNLATGTVTVVEGSCILVCESLVPSNAASRTELPFWAFAALSNCTDSISYIWNFGDGGHSTNALAQHAYGKNGSYPWNVVATADGMSVTNSGLITVGNFQLDTDGDGIEDDWEWAVFKALDIAGGDSDFDGDDQSDVEEYLCGSDARDPGSNLAFTGIQASIVRWSSTSNRVYTVNATTSLTATAFAPLATDIISTPPENTYTDLTTSVSDRFFRIELE